MREQAAHQNLNFDPPVAGNAGQSLTARSRQIRYSRDGTRAYLRRDNGDETAQVWVLRIEPKA